MNQGHCLIELLIAIAILLLHIQLGVTTLHALNQAMRMNSDIYRSTLDAQRQWENQLSNKKSRGQQ